ncbi:hypothetical protein BJX61DRAFT_18322 [Aspergillus egyptiacus]|nr:hypothetical protein BJX61DRAFT_18322 [Aspergillus egyptiacus]
MASHTTLRSLLALPLAGGIAYLAYLAAPCRSMRFIWHAAPGHATSFPMHVIDPASNPTEEETYILGIPLRKLTKGISDEEILARLSRGYFGGWGFSPERWIAPWVQGIIDHDVVTNATISNGDASAELVKISSPDSLSRDHLPALGACLFDLYYLLDTSACSTEHRTRVFPGSAQFPRPEGTFAEYAGRTKGRSLAASHRFEVIRETVAGEEQVKIIYSHVRSNPRTGGRVYSTVMTGLHVLYAHLLFADGIREVLNR